MAGLDRAVEAGKASQGGKPDILLPAHGEKPLHDESAVEAGEPDDVADGAEGDEIEPVQKVRLLGRRRSSCGREARD